jgi:nucleotidyltransferase/DNA polymerase involved in DNA repair
VGSVALVDCNNFYASCARLFEPALRGRPVAVLSNNDGGVIARRNEANALGIGMGEPWHPVPRPFHGRRRHRTPLELHRSTAILARA